ncbi:hypothetical protein GPJ56_005193 [Histomonas meleagridis]|uniref:uncharacterized protein n=1 Tax=Histomonas meleagridis TaxID=135588 RepID=UPI0035598ED3|nr:hypothetical protein GPJ56_005193 [Histomonas meleagridis]KAH0802709.1 hypothetical protein GO595_004758 [Histomonas meleagridis]
MNSLVIGAGQNFSGQVGAESDDSSANGYPIVKVPVAIPIDPKGIVSIAAGFKHSVFVFDDGKVVVIGDDRNSQIGTPDKQAYLKPTSVTINTQQKILQAACGQYYTAYLLDDGSILICGWRRNGEPFTFKPDEKFVFINAGFDSPVAIDSKGDFYIFDSDYTKPPQKYHLDQPVYDIARGQDFVLVVTLDNKVYGNGIMNEDKSQDFKLIKSLSPYKITRVYASYSVAGALSDDGKALLHAQEGFVVVEGLQDEKIIDMDVGQYYSIFVAEDGKMYSCGDNIYGELLLGRTDDQPVSITLGPFSLRSKISYVKCGTHHSFAIVNGGNVPHLGKMAFNK